MMNMYAVPKLLTDEEILDLLEEIDEYLSQREDCDVENGVHIPNKEMNLRNRLGPLKDQIEKRIKEG